MTENQIAKAAFDALTADIGLTVTLKPAPTPEIDGIAIFQHKGVEQIVFFEVKKTVSPAQLPKLEALNKKYAQFLVIAEHIYPKLKNELKFGGINYLEVNGNVCLKTDHFILYKEDQNTPAPERVRGRAFTKTALKLVFQLLDHDELLDLTYREMAEATGVGFGNINVILTDLKEQGFLVPINKDAYKFNRKKELLEKWMVAYEQKLRPELFMGNYRFLNQRDFADWKGVELQHDKTWWGGEAGGNMLTNYLLPEMLTLYTVETKTELMRNYKLVPDEAGNVAVYQKFWNYAPVKDAFVPTLLIYTDLMLTGDRRCIETAQKIWNEQLSNKF